MKKITTLLLSLTLPLGLTGCNQGYSDGSRTEAKQKVAEQLDVVQNLMTEGKSTESLNILEALDEQHPDNESIIEALALYHASVPDNTLAAFYFEQLSRLNPKRSEAVLSAAECYVELGEWEAAARNYEDYLQKNPEKPHIWKNFAIAKTQLNQPKPALKAYLNAMNLLDNKATPDEAMQIAELFIQFGNYARAQEFYNTAAQSSERAVDALLGLLLIDIQSQNWHAAQKTIQKIDKLDENALAASSLAYARHVVASQADANGATLETASQPGNIDYVVASDQEVEAAAIAKTKSHAAAMQAQAEAAVAAAQQKATEMKKKGFIAKDSAPQASNKRKQKTGQKTVAAKKAQPAQEPSQKPALAAKNNSKPQAAEKAAAAAQEEPASSQVAASSETETEQKVSAAQADAKKMAQKRKAAKIKKMKMLAWAKKKAVEEQQAEAKETPAEASDDILTMSLTRGEEAPTEEKAAAAEGEAEPTETVAVKELTEEEITLQEADQLEAEGTFHAAIQKYWKILRKDESKHTVWYLLSEAYYKMGLYEEAQRASQKALDAEPNSLRYTIHNLKIVQQTETTENFIAELQKAKAAFPNTPEITLGLARAYEKYNEGDAAMHYLEFIRQAPTHAKKEEAKEALQRLL